MDMKENAEVQAFLNDVCGYVKFKDCHPQIRMELENHLEEKVSECMEQGMTEDDAVRKALGDMGNVECIGKGLNKVHGKGYDLGLLLSSLLLVLAGIGCSYVIFSSRILNCTGINMKRTLLYLFIGISLAWALYAWDYRKLQKHSPKLLAAAMLLTLACLFSPVVNGARGYFRFGSFSICISSFALVLFIIAACGMLSKSYESGKKKFAVLMTCYFLPACSMLVVPDVSGPFLYTLAFLFIMFSTGCKLKHALPVLATDLVFVLASFSNPHFRTRFQGFLKYKQYPQGIGYQYAAAHSLTSSAGIFGQGIKGSALNKLPGMHTDFIFTFITYVFGWFGAAVLVAVIAMFLSRLFKMGSCIKDDYGKLLVKTLAVLVGLEFAMNIFMNLGLVPVTGISLPFISYGGSNIVANLMMVGFIMGIYRRRNLNLEVIEKRHS